MKQNLLQAVSIQIDTISRTQSNKELHKAIVDSALHIIQADCGQLYLYSGGRLKKIYSSSNLIKKTTLTKQPTFKKSLKSAHQIVLSRQTFNTLSPSIIPEHIQSIVIVPLQQGHYPLGVLLLYCTTERTQLTEQESSILKVLSQSAVLALTKTQLQDEYKKALEIRDRFISLASHELRTPLTSLHGYIQLLYAKMAQKDTVEARWVNELHIESVRLTTLVKELLDVNRIKQGQFAFVFSEVAMHDVVNKAIDKYRLTHADHPFIYQNKITDSQAKVVGDFDKLVEMVSGLLGNALKFSKPEDKITITLKNDDGMLTLIVKDTGRGIAKKDLTEIFDGFYKSAHASHIEGMGVGLFLARYIVDNHRGKIKIISKEYKGTTVVVNLPTIKTARN